MSSWKRSEAPSAWIRLPRPDSSSTVADVEFEVADGPEKSRLVGLLKEQMPLVWASLQPAGSGWTLSTRELQIDGKAPQIADRPLGLGTILQVFGAPDDPGLHLGPVPLGATEDEWRRPLAREELLRLPWIPRKSAAALMPPDSQTAPGSLPPCRLGTSQPPLLEWCYVRDPAGQQIQVEVSWTLAGLPEDWATLLEKRLASEVVCHEVGGRLQVTLQRKIREVEPPFYDLVFRGVSPPLGRDDVQAVERTFRLDSPVVLGNTATATFAVPLTVPILDLTAWIDDARTRFVAEEDARKPVRLEVSLDPRLWLPPQIPLAVVEPTAFPGGFTVSAAGAPEAAGNQTSAPWRLEATGDDDRQGLWQDVRWPQDDALSLRIGNTAASVGAPLRKIGSRKVKLGWEAAEQDGAGNRLCLLRPAWWPRGCELDGTFQGGGEAYEGTVSLTLNGLEERFAVDGLSELPEEPLFLDPYRWQVSNRKGEPTVPALIYGHAETWIWWLFARLPGEPGRPAGPIAPAKTGGAPLLVLGDPLRSKRCWGCLHVPTSPASEPPAEQDVEQITGVIPGNGMQQTLFIDEDVPWAWIYLRGLFECYDMGRVEMRGLGTCLTWTARQGLPLFPASRSPLLRSLAPFYAEEAGHDEIGLRPGEERPTLRLGRTLRAPNVPRTLHPDPDTRLRFTFGQATDRGAPPRWDGVSVPGHREPVTPPAGNLVFWAALEPLESDGIPGRFLLSWDSGSGWRFRGFYAPVGEAVRLGGMTSHSAVVLRGRSASDPSHFSLTVVDRENGPEFQWSLTTPSSVVSEVSDFLLGNWYRQYDLKPDRRPEPLQAFLPTQVSRRDAGRVVEFFAEKGSMPAPVDPAIQLWVPRARTTAEPRESGGISPRWGSEAGDDGRPGGDPRRMP